MEKNISYYLRDNQQKNRVEFQIRNFDYIDGGDKIANIWSKKYDVLVSDRIDGIWLIVTPIINQGNKLNIVWHEDCGIFIYSENQTEEANYRLEEMVKYAVEEINRQIDIYNQNNPS